ncbi:BLUF domain-containing protein [Methyloligella solikamskensis]|uniref:BLUF domain-containing protein n=1 Tax=Methyloligella solikamskensis TaxID=1177756 RepID=A0ABW3JDB2_9HYPH
MHLIVYVSDCAVPDGELKNTLEEVDADSRRNNAAADLTGVLFCENRHFLQVLEGEEDALRAAMARIEKDHRHRNIEILVDQSIESRSFPDWSLDTFFIDDPELLTPETLRSLRDIYFKHFELDARDLVAFLKRIIDEIDSFKILHRPNTTNDVPP